MNSNDKILILDFGSQYTQLIARRVREIGVFSEVKPSSISTEEIIKMNPSGIILSGGPEGNLVILIFLMLIILFYLIV